MICSLNAAKCCSSALIGAGAGTAWSLYQTWGRRWVDGLRGFRTLAPEEPTLALLAARQVALLRALLRRGHAATQPVSPGKVSGWPGADVRDAVLRARSHPEWSALNGTVAGSRAEVAITPLVDALRSAAEAPEAAQK